jgi:hypothetical protein
LGRAAAPGAGFWLDARKTPKDRIRTDKKKTRFKKTLGLEDDMFAILLMDGVIILERASPVNKEYS